MSRTSTINRITLETQIQLTMNLDGSGSSNIATNIGFFDHMLDHTARHGLIDLEVSAVGDLHVDYHHTVEDVGLCFGDALKQAVGDRTGIRRYGFFALPMDEALAQTALDLSGRPLFVYSNPLSNRSAGNFSLDLIQVFFQAVVQRGGLNLHISVSAEDPHHAAEAVFKSFGRALREAVEFDPRVKGVPSTKGVLE